MFGGDDLDSASLNGDRRGSVMSLDSEAYRPNMKSSDRVSSRMSIISMNEREYGWSTNASGVANVRRADTAAKRARPPAVRASSSVDSIHAAAPRRGTYRPPFAPAKFDLTDNEEDEATDIVAMPVLRQRASTGEEAAAPAMATNLNRGRSFRQKIGDAISGRRSTVTKDRSGSADPPPSRRNTISHPPAGEDSGSGSDNWAAQVVRRVSRRATRPKVRESEQAYDSSDSNAGGLGHFSSRLSTYDMAELPAEIASIPLYAPPKEAGCSDAPALSSFAPRPPLRPRAATMDSVSTGGATSSRPVQTVAQAARTYTIKRAQTSAATTANAKAGSDASGKGAAASGDKARYKASDSASVARRRERKAQVVPAGWGTAASLDEKVLTTVDKV